MPSPTFTRRALIAGTGATIASVAIGIPCVNAAHSENVRSLSDTPEYEDLTRYYAFLWSEFQELGDELGVGQHCSTTAHRNGDIVALKAPLTAPPSTRALSVLAACGVSRAEVPSITNAKQGSRPSDDEVARTKLYRAAKDIREAMALLGHRDFMVFVKDKPGGVGISKVIDFAAGGESYSFA